MSARGGREPAAVRDLLTTVRRTLDARAMVKGGETVVLAVSGGPDSLAMLHAFARIAPALDLRLHVAHFDHRLRSGSDRDAAFVARHAARLALPVTIGAAESTERPRGRSPEEAARDRRRRFLASVAEEVGATRIALAHTLDDQAETVLMRMLTGSGRAGLGGIDPVRWWWIRPLIDVRRAEVEAFVRALRLRPRIDPSNADRRFLRNALRLDVIPLLRATVNERLPEAMARAADVLRDEDRYLDTKAAELAGPEVHGDEARVSVEALRALPAVLQRRVIRILVRTYGDAPTFERTEAVRALALRGETGGTVDLAQGLSARVEYGFIVVGRVPPRSAPAAPLDLVVPGETDLLPWGLRMRGWITSETPVLWPDDSVAAVLDADRISFPLRVRRWHPGDRFRPLGMPRSKKVGDFFTDAKVPKDRRGKVPIIVDRDGAIVWLVGHRIDDRFKVTPASRRTLWLTVEEAT